MTECRIYLCFANHYFSYVCSKTITNGYSHFNEPSRGGKQGNCPLFDNTEQRHDEDVKKAEQEAVAKVRAENPGLNEEEIKVQVSKTVFQAEQRRIQHGQNPHAQAMPYAPPAYLPIRLDPQHPVDPVNLR